MPCGIFPHQQAPLFPSASLAQQPRKRTVSCFGAKSHPSFVECRSPQRGSPGQKHDTRTLPNRLQGPRGPRTGQTFVRHDAKTRGTRTVLTGALGVDLHYTGLGRYVATSYHPPVIPKPAPLRPTSVLVSKTNYPLQRAPAPSFVVRGVLQRRKVRRRPARDFQVGASSVGLIGSRSPLISRTSHIRPSNRSTEHHRSSTVVFRELQYLTGPNRSARGDLLDSSKWVSFSGIQRP